ncbi:MAG: RHS repeat protein, partial [Verrucomicrobia bacterium]|nr:RHS repeat protein [Verrucomicrobiota bacterium]
MWGKTINIDTYNDSGKITHWRYPGYSAGDEVVYAYDDIGRLTTITDNMPASGSKVTAIDYDQDTGAMVKVT